MCEQGFTHTYHKIKQKRMYHDRDCIIFIFCCTHHHLLPLQLIHSSISLSLSSSSLLHLNQLPTNSSSAPPPSNTPLTSLVSYPLPLESLTNLYGCMT
mmetsp:Transcript_41065/g.86278  ORF Transcript_41065/g.86278 Transcript_41065/m.86278 type:complete len:98 (+) Transcript_41065:231-524(+)